MTACPCRDCRVRLGATWCVVHSRRRAAPGAGLDLTGRRKHGGRPAQASMDLISSLMPISELAPDDVAVVAFLARYRGTTLRAYKLDMLAFLTWCAARDLTPLRGSRPHLELYLRWMEERGYAQATIGRRFGTVGGFYKCAVLDGRPATDPAAAVSRPRVPWESQRRTVLHPLEYAALLTAARRDGASSHALVALLGMLGLRVSRPAPLT